MNWSEIIKSLEELGFTQSEIARECGTSQSNISGLRTSSRNEPRYELGKRILAMLEKAKAIDPENREAA